MNQKIVANHPPDSESDDSELTDESEAFRAKRNLESVAEEKQHGRRELLRDEVSRWLKYWIIVIALILIAATMIFAYHMLTPQSWQWLSDEDLTVMKDTLTSVAAGVFFGFLINNKFL